MNATKEPDQDPEDDIEDLFEHAPCGYLSLKPDGRIVRANATLLAWLGMEGADVKGKRLQELLTMPGRIYYETHFAPLLRMQGYFHEVALDFLTREGAPIPTLVNAEERKDDNGVPAFVRVTVFNTTDRRRYERELLDARSAADTANAALRALNDELSVRVDRAVAERVAAEDAQRQMQKMEAVGLLTGGIAHDFNNMLAVVIGALNLVERRRAKGEDASGLLNAAMDGALRAAELTKRLLAFSRQTPLSPVALSINRLVANMSELLRRTLGEQVELETVLAGGLWTVRTDAGQLENALINLAVNARDAMSDGGKITIETGNAHLDDAYAAAHTEVAAGQYVMIAVTDTGSGMSDAVMARAFDPFFTTKEVGKGTGLGLSQIFGYVKQSNGHVKIYSELGHGTTIRLYFPRHIGAVEEVAEPLPTPAPISVAAEYVLVVEDDERMREIAVASLRELGYNVAHANSGPEALKILSARPEISLLLTDIVMPRMNGRQLADAALKLNPALKIVFTTGYTRNAVIHNNVLDAGVMFLSKPFTLDQLANKLREALS